MHMCKSDVDESFLTQIYGKYAPLLWRQPYNKNSIRVMSAQTYSELKQGQKSTENTRGEDNV